MNFLEPHVYCSHNKGKSAYKKRRYSIHFISGVDLVLRVALGKQDKIANT